MGWSGYGIYDGDDTRGLHLEFMKWAGIKLNEEEMEDWFEKFNKTKIPKDKVGLLKKNHKLILDKMPKVNFLKPGTNIFSGDSSAISWQMLMCLFLDNKIKPPKIIYQNGVQATKYLMGWHANDFDEPSRRKANLRNLLKKAENIYHAQKS
jgi:hypothetical protein